MIKHIEMVFHTKLEMQINMGYTNLKNEIWYMPENLLKICYNLEYLNDI